MIKRLLPLMLMLLTVVAAPSQAAIEMLSVKLVKSTKNGSVTPGLEDVAAIIKRNLPYNGCEQIDQKACVLPANATLVFRGNYQMMLQSQGSELAVTITRKERTLISTRITLKANTPVIIGGFFAETKGAKHIFVFQRSK